MGIRGTHIRISTAYYLLICNHSAICRNLIQRSDSTNFWFSEHLPRTRPSLDVYEGPESWRGYGISFKISPSVLPFLTRILITARCSKLWEFPVCVDIVLTCEHSLNYPLAKYYTKNNLKKNGCSKKLDVWVSYELTTKKLMNPIFICESVLNSNKIHSYLVMEKKKVIVERQWAGTNELQGRFCSVIARFGKESFKPQIRNCTVWRKQSPRSPQL